MPLFQSVQGIGAGALRKVRREERSCPIFRRQVAQDRVGLPDGRVAVFQRRDQAIGVERQEIRVFQYAITWGAKAFRDALEFTRYLIENIGVAVVPASSFSRPGDAEAMRRVRFCFPKRDETLLEAGLRLQRLRAG